MDKRMKIIPVLLIGCGGVGRQLIHHMVSCRPLHAKQGVHLRVIGVCDSRSLVVAADVLTTELYDKILLEICHVKLDGASLSNLSSFVKLPDEGLSEHIPTSLGV